MKREPHRVQVWCINDSVIPPGYENYVNTILICSPGSKDDAEEIKRWVKNSRAKQFVLPPCTCHEILSIRHAHFGTNARHILPSAVVKRRFQKWGGVPRTILGSNEDIRKLEDKFSALKIGDAIKYLGKQDVKHSELSGSIFHLRPSLSMSDSQVLTADPEDFYGSGAGYWWASEELASQGWANWGAQNESDVIS